MMLKDIVKLSKNGFYKKNGDYVELKAENLVKKSLKIQMH